MSLHGPGALLHTLSGSFHVYCTGSGNGTFSAHMPLSMKKCAAVAAFKFHKGKEVAYMLDSYNRNCGQAQQ